MRGHATIMKRLRSLLGCACTALAAVFIAGCASFKPVASSAVSVPPDSAADARRYDEQWFAAARLGRVDILQALVNAGYPIDATTHDGYTAVILAAYRDQPAALDYLLRAGANPCAGDRYGNTALMGALFRGREAIAAQLIDTRCPIDQANHAGQTALSFAVMFGRLDWLPRLVARGADPDHVDALGHTVLQTAILQGNMAAVTALEKVGATPNADITLRLHP